MQFNQICAFLAVAIVAVSAAPNPGYKPPKPAPPPIVKQTNYCGNGVTAYCCNSESGFGQYTDCSSFDQSTTCSGTIVCCNANDSIQTCIGTSNSGY
jgi:hypothetical protein